MGSSYVDRSYKKGVAEQRDTICVSTRRTGLVLSPRVQVTRPGVNSVGGLAGPRDADTDWRYFVCSVIVTSSARA